MYGDPYSNINQMVGQGYAQDAQIRQHGTDQASALSQYFMDAFIRTRAQQERDKQINAQMEHQKQMESIAIARQRGLDANRLRDDWNATGTEDMVPKFNADAAALNVPSPVPEQKFRKPIPGFKMGTDNPSATENNPTVNIGSPSELVGPTEDGSDLMTNQSTAKTQLLPGNTQDVAASPIDREGILVQLLRQKANANSDYKSRQATTSENRASSQNELNKHRQNLIDTLVSEKDALTQKALRGDIPYLEARTRILDINAQTQQIMNEATIAQKYSAASNSAAGASEKSAFINAGGPQNRADMYGQGADAAQSLSELRDARTDVVENPLVKDPLDGKFTPKPDTKPDKSYKINGKEYAVVANRLVLLNQ